MKEIERKQIEDIIESRDERLVAELIDLVKESNMSSKDTGKKYSLADKISDRVAAFAGSWTFIIGFVVLMIMWIIFNILASKAPDPFPFILLNLILSMTAALQAPLVMMSQNREEERNKEKATSDFFVNIKSELLIEDIHTSVKNIEKDYEEIKVLLYQLQNNQNKPS